MTDRMKLTPGPSIFRALPGYPWQPCPICGYSGDSCDCTVRERAIAAHPGLQLDETGERQ